MVSRTACSDRARLPPRRARPARRRWRRLRGRRRGGGLVPLRGHRGGTHQQRGKQQEGGQTDGARKHLLSDSVTPARLMRDRTSQDAAAEDALGGGGAERFGVRREPAAGVFRFGLQLRGGRAQSRLPPAPGSAPGFPRARRSRSGASRPSDGRSRRAPQPSSARTPPSPPGLRAPSAPPVHAPNAIASARCVHHPLQRRNSSRSSRTVSSSTKKMTHRTDRSGSTLPPARETLSH